MPSSPSPLLRLELQATGEALNTWGTRLNTVISLAEQAIAGALIKPLSGNTTLTTTNYAADEARNATLIFTAGAGLTASPTVTVPQVAKQWFVQNRTTFPIVMTCGGTDITIPASRQGPVVCDGMNLSLFEPVSEAVAVASAITTESARQAGVSATSAASSAGTATTSRNAAQTARDEARAARDAAQASATSASTSATNAANSATAAANSAAGVNLPAITSADAGKFLTVRPDGAGYIPITLSIPVIAPITLTTPAANATNLGAGGTYTFVVQAFPGDTTGYYSDYGFAATSRTVRVFNVGGTTPIKTFTATGGGPTLPVDFTSSGLANSTLYEFDFTYADAKGNTATTQRVQATTAAQFKPGIGQAYEGGFLAYEQFGDGQLFDLVTGAKSAEQSKPWWVGTAPLLGAYSRLNGPSNTALIGSSTAYAGGYAASIMIGGIAGYLAAIDEARAISFKLRPANAPAGTPFVAGGSEFFPETGHWSSTEINASTALTVGMTNGNEGAATKSTSQFVRPIKRIQLTPPIPIGTFVAAQGGWLWFFFTDLSSGAPITYAVFKADKAVEVTLAYSTVSQATGRTSRTNGTTQISTSSSYPALMYCGDLVHNNKEDWYLGAIDEMLSGLRTNSQLPLAQRMEDQKAYWSSTETEGTTGNAKGISGTGSEFSGVKTAEYRVIPIRRVPLSQLAA